MSLADVPAWYAQAACAENAFIAEMFFPEKGGSSRAAKAICATCPVRPDCLDLALRRDEPFGIWGGMSPFERRRLLRAAS